MKKLTALVSAALLMWNVQAVPLAARKETRAAEPPVFELFIDPTVESATYSVGSPVLYGFGQEEAGSTADTGGKSAQIAITPRLFAKDGRLESDAYKITQITAAAQTPNITVSVERRDGTVYDGREGPLLTLTANVGPQESMMQDYSVLLNLTVGDWNGMTVTNKKDIVVTMHGEQSVGYSRAREIEGGGNYRVDEAGGCIFSAVGTIYPGALVDCGDGISITFEGDYDDGSVNLYTTADMPGELNRRLSSGARYCSFAASPTLTSPVTVSIGGIQDSSVYRVEGDSFSVIDTEYENGVHRFATSSLGAYVVTLKDPLSD